ncbi:MAG: hypothetical protein HY611_03630, partial [Elusimicrobia bacterium]|nr:hypothetical protein [Elusimicrobiota bacterium]
MTFPPKLQELPIEAKWLITLVLTSFCFNHLAAAALVWEVTRDVAPSAQAHFAYKSFAALLRMTHQHAFGHGTMYFITGAIFLLAGCGRKLTLALITLPFIGAWADVASWFLL